MNSTRTLGFLALAFFLADGLPAAAQSNNIPGPNDYGRFSSFISDRNIFDPGRFSHDPAVRQRFSRPQFTPTFSLVGIMSYEKGVFAFFDGNQSDLRKVLYQSASNSIAGFTVAEITPNGVTLQSADKRQTVPLKIGENMRKEGSTWQKAGPGASITPVSGGETAAPAASDNSAAPSAGESNDILKKLMQQREQELK